MKNLLLFVVCPFLLSACSSNSFYGVGFKSNLPFRVTELRAYTPNGEYFAGAGTMGASPKGKLNAGKYEHGITGPVPDEIVLKWKEPDGTMKAVPVVLKGTVPKHLREQTIILTITETGDVEIDLKKDPKVW